MKQMPEISREELENLIDQWIIGLHAKRNRAILKRRIIDGIIFDELSAEFRLSDKQVKRIVYRGMDTIFSHRKGG